MDKRKVKGKESTPLARASARPKFQTVSEIEARGLAVPASFKSIIIDATGKEERILSSATGLMTPTRSGSPEIESVKIAKRAKRDLEAFADAWNAEEENKNRVIAEGLQIGKEVGYQQSVIRRLQGVVQTLEVMNLDGFVPGGGSLADQWEEAIAKLEGLQDMYSEEIEDYGLSEAAVASLEPLFKRQMLEWDPMTNPAELVSPIQRVQLLLGTNHEATNRRRKTTTCYESLILLHWFPRVRDTLNREWDVYSPDNAVALVKAWQPVLPIWVQTKVMDGVIVPRLAAAIKTWRPNSRRNSTKNGVHPPMHAWLFDWLPLLGEDHLNPKQPETILALVKNKLDVDEWPYWKPLLGEKRRVPVPASIAAAPEVDDRPRQPAADLLEVTFKDVVEDWCVSEDLMIVPLHQPHRTGLPLYRLRSASGKSSGIVVYLQGDVVWSESGEPFGLDNRLADLARGR